MQPVDFKDLVYAETVTSLSGKNLRDVGQDKNGAAREFAQQLYASFMRIKVDGQDVQGIDLNRRDAAVETISAEIQKVVAEKMARHQALAEEIQAAESDVAEVSGVVDDLPKGCVRARVTRVGMGFFTVTPADGGKAMQIDMSPRAARVELGTNIIARPLQGKPLKDSHVRIPAELVRVEA